MHAAVAPTRPQTIGTCTSPEEVRPVTLLQAHVTADSGNATIYGTTAATPGNDVIRGGSGTDTLYRGTGLDEIYGGSGTNYIYGEGEHDVLTGGSGSNYIQPNANGGGLASIQVKDDDYQPTYDGNIDQNGHATSGDSQAVDPGYGGGGCWKFNDLDSGARLGEDTVTPVAVYVTWNNSVSLDGGTRWAASAVYSVYDVGPGGTPDSGNLVGSMTVDQQGSPGSDSPEPNDRPWTRLGVWNVNAGDTLTVELSDPNAPSGDRLCVGDAMIHPLWPTVDIQQTGVTVPTQVPATASAASDYVDWYDAANPASIPVEGSGSRTEFALSATVDPLFAEAPPYSGAPWNWTAKMPAVSGLEYWSASQSGTQLTAGADGSVQLGSINPGSTPYSSDIWVSTGPASPPVADPFSVTFEACAPPGPGDAAGKAGLRALPEAPFIPVGTFHIFIQPNVGRNFWGFYDSIWRSDAVVTWYPPGFDSLALTGFRVSLFQRVLTQTVYSGPRLLHSSLGEWHNDNPKLLAKGNLTDWSAFAPMGPDVVQAAPGVFGENRGYARLEDAPGQNFRFPYQVSITQVFQDAAVCVTPGDNYGRVLGWVTWSVTASYSGSGDFKIESAPDEPAPVWLRVNRKPRDEYDATDAVQWPGPSASAPGSEPPPDFLRFYASSKLRV